MYCRKIENTKGAIRSRKWKNRQYNDKQKKDKTTNNDLQNIIQKTNDQATRTLLKIECELMCFGRQAVSVPLVALVVLLYNYLIIIHIHIELHRLVD